MILSYTLLYINEPIFLHLSSGKGAFFVIKLCFFVNINLGKYKLLGYNGIVIQSKKYTNPIPFLAEGGLFGIMDSLNLNAAMDALLKFRAERDWSKFHTPKNLAVSIAIEAAELMEHFQWKTDDEAKEYLSSSKYEDVKDEIADIASYLLLLSHDLGIDLNKAILDKVKKNGLKYPVGKCRGKSNKYNDL